MTIIELIKSTTGVNDMRCSTAINELNHDRQGMENQAQFESDLEFFNETIENEIATLAETEWEANWLDAISELPEDDISGLQHAFIMGDTCEMGHIIERAFEKYLGGLARQAFERDWG